MKTLVAYASRHGTAEKIAHLISLELEHCQVRLLDLKHENPRFDLAEYENVIVGGSIHYGEIQNVVKDFCNKYHHELMQKGLGLFLCYMRDEVAKKEFDHAFPESLQNHAKALGYFGGEILFEKMNLVERFVVSTVGKKTENEFHVDEEAIGSFILKMNQV